MSMSQGGVTVLEGPEPVDVPSQNPDQKVEPNQLASKFKRFVKEYAYHTAGYGGANVSTLKYREQLIQNCSRGVYQLKVNLNDLNSWSTDGELLENELEQNPTEFVPLAERSLKELYEELVMQGPLEEGQTVPDVQLILTCDADLEGSFGTIKPHMVRDLGSAQVEKLVVVQGICISVKKCRHKARRIVWQCTNCENIKESIVPDGYCSSHIPSQCDGNSLGLEKCPPKPFVVLEDRCFHIDEQTIKLQELPEHVPVGEMPRSFDLHMHNNLVDVLVPGTRLTAIGVFCATERSAGASMASGRGRGGVATVKYSYIKVLGVDLAQGGKTAIQVTAEEEEQFRAMAKDPNIRQKIYDSIAPSIRGSAKDVVNEVKKALAVLLFGGSRKPLVGGGKMRGDVNMLLIGDPGTAKSQFLKFAEKVAPIAVYTSGKGSSAAGLTAAIIRDKDGFTLEGGAMVLADGGIVCIDEFDKMDIKDRVAIHEAMEQQTISIAKAGITTMLNTRCSVVAAANPRFGTHDDLTSTVDQCDFEETILSRFDMIFVVKDVRDEERDFELAAHMVGLHSGAAVENREGPIPVLQLRKYLAYCRNRCEPRVSSEAAETLINNYVSIRQSAKQEKSMPITVRQLEAIIRMSEALAKMELREDADEGHVAESLRLFHVSTLDAANKERGEMNFSNMAPELAEKMSTAEEQLKRLVPRGARKKKIALHSALVNTGIDERMANRVIQNMIREGILQELANDTVLRA
mmetsp:Transcript_60407/g.128031  ORF Transcript_60407/g.128031 Transcript_60407/m.128031 type:complete len:746 (+) Transcript_60407:114-2351(+)|eukprot:CAMPEP_0206458476 /NCGR_PEP_ID=MMETSP0324_2-20121206/23595_1 /ASSEMBLY_ACC=CAM_ASM_000836 /TAXON_ID=2866 /ORGANISM="Crypthecodinium cohnii, Strain Seligo" /LENGTH=745 /DNA_ID=CAMNT_0053929827 /DNA_START=78 /DNA_END=2315 /DNA_ORIENTATION=+